MDFKEKIQKYLKDVLQVEYTGDLEYTVDPYDEFYSLSWQLNPEDNRPLILQGTFSTEDEFYCFVIKEIKNKRFHVYKNFRAYRITPEHINSDVDVQTVKVKKNEK